MQKQQTFFCMDWVFDEPSDAEDDALMFMISLLFAGMGSRIHQKARQAGLTYGTNGFLSSKHAVYNEFGFSDQTAPEHALSLFELILREIYDIREGNFSTDEYNRVCGYAYNRLKNKFQLPGDYLSWYNRDFLHDRPFMNIQKALEIIQNFPRADIAKTAKKHLNDNWLLTVRGQDIQESDFRNAIKRYF